MSLFEQLVFVDHPVGLGGTHAILDFPNGYGASVVSGDMFYCRENMPYELAVMKCGDLCYDTPITNDVIGYLTKDEVESILVQISNLPPVEV